jgi:hypothetical protein
LPEYPGVSRYLNRKGLARGIVGQSAVTLTEEDSGSLILFTGTTGYTVTLPPAMKGLHFDIVFNDTIGSGTARLACASGDFFRGTLQQGTDTTYLPALRTANGTTHLAFEGNGSTTSGFAGDAFSILAISDTIWQVIARGPLMASGTEATFWKTS